MKRVNHLSQRFCILFVFILFYFPIVHAQENLLSYDRKHMHYGITLGINYTDFKITHVPDFLLNDTLLVIEPSAKPGFNIGLISDLRLGEFFNLRFLPALSLARRELIYTFIDNSQGTKLVESYFIEFPLTLKYKSARHKNFRVYVLGGIKYSIDLASQAKVKESDDDELLVKLYRHNIGYEYGFGFDFYFPLFKFATELKITNGINNVLVPEPHVYVSSIEKLLSKIVLISMHFE